MGLLPGPDDATNWPEQPPQPTVALAANATGRFADTWSRVRFPASNCIWTQDLSVHDEATCILPSAHGEGRFVVNDPSTIDQLRTNHRVAVTYHKDDNFNGSMGAIAGICDATGYVFGLMPHPERYTRWAQHPFWTRLEGSQTGHEPIGLQMFRNAVRCVEANAACATAGSSV